MSIPSCWNICRMWRQILGTKSLLHTKVDKSVVATEPAMRPHTTHISTALTAIFFSLSSQCFLTSPAAMPRTILARVSRLFSPRFPRPPSSGPKSLHSSARRFSSSFVSRRPLKRPYMQNALCQGMPSGFTHQDLTHVGQDAGCKTPGWLKTRGF